MRLCSIRSGSNRCRFGEDAAMKMDQRILTELADLESRSQLRHLEAARDIDLGSNDYLGLAFDPRMKHTVREALDAAPRFASTGWGLLSGHD